MSRRTLHKFTFRKHPELINDTKFWQLFRKRPELIEDVEFVEEVRSFLEAHPYMIDEIHLIKGSDKQRRYFKTKPENYRNPSPAQAKVRLKVAKTSTSHFGEKGLRECKGVKMPLACRPVQEAFKDYEARPKPYSKKMRQRIEAKRKPTWEETMKELREAFIGIAQVVEEFK